MSRPLISFTYFLVLTVILMASYSGSHAQNGHFWTQHYGTRSMLLSGSVIGGVDDIGAIFYNPARLAEPENPAFIISADVLELSTLKITDTYDGKFDKKDSDFGSVPSLTAGTFNLPFLEGHYFAWAVFNRHNDDFGFNFENDFEEVEEITDSIADIEHFNTDIAIGNNLREQWYGAGWAHPVNDNTSIGASMFLARIRQSKTNSTDFQALSANDDITFYRYHRNLSFTQYNLVIKLGASMVLDNAIIGGTLLLPGIKLSGNGSYRYEEFFSEADTAANSPDLYNVNVQNDLETRYRSPLGIGLGITVPYKKNKVHLSAEWFSSVSEYQVMNPEPHTGQSGDNSVNFILIDEFNSILNFGLGFEWFINDKVSGYASFSLDRAAGVADVSELISNDSIMYNSNMNSDFYHFGGGVVLNLIGADITVGATYTGASQNFKTPIRIPDDQFDDIYDPNHESTLNWNRWRFIFSFSIPFLENKVKDIEKKFGF